MRDGGAEQEGGGEGGAGWGQRQQQPMPGDSEESDQWPGLTATKNFYYPGAV